jgi:hypothetical protein
MLTREIYSSLLLRLLSHSFLPLLLRARQLTSPYVHVAFSLSSSREPDPQTSRIKTRMQTRTRTRTETRMKTPRRHALSSRSALAPQVKLSSAAMRQSILRVSKDISSCATRPLEKHATMVSMIRARSKGEIPLSVES